MKLYFRILLDIIFYDKFNSIITRARIFRCLNIEKYLLFSCLLLCCRNNEDLFHSVPLQFNVERDFSNSGRILTDDKASMSVRMLNAWQNVQYALKKPWKSTRISPSHKRNYWLLARSACFSYIAYIEKKKMEQQLMLKNQENNKKMEEESKWVMKKWKDWRASKRITVMKWKQVTSFLKQLSLYYKRLWTEMVLRSKGCLCNVTRNESHQKREEANV